MELRILSSLDIGRCMDMPEAIDAMRDAFGQLSAGEAEVPQRLAISTPGGISLFMPGYLPESGDLAAKIVSVYGSNPDRGLPVVNAVVVLLDGSTGIPVAVMNGTSLTALRTGAAGGLAAELLALPEADTVALFGAGVQARTQLEAVRAVRPIRRVRILSRSGESAARLVAELEGVDAEVASDPVHCLEGARIVITATDASEPVFPGELVTPGTHVTGVGSFTPDMQEVDATLVTRAKVVVDSREAALAEAGDLIIPIRDGSFRPEDIHAELGELVRGLRSGRDDPSEVTFFKSVGSAAQDVAVAGRIFRRAQSMDLGTLVEL